MPESLAQILIRLLKYLRRFLLETAICFTGLTAIIYWLSPHFLTFLQSHFQQRLAFFGVLEPILALLKLSSVGALILMAPWILWRMSQGLVDVLGFSRKSSLVFMLSALLLFYAGALFCFFITLPFGINFLLGYQSQHLRPVIAVGKFVNFIGLFLLSFGLIFEIPLVMTLLCRLKICGPETFGRYRRYAILLIAVMAAVLTPTPDVFNMALMGVPLYVLYETGIIIAGILNPPSI
ncbi:MAG: preprotein translocase [Deltaproteobacteria bacterium]|nr:MAG: preprotein translocase [Deltaproteobacteria bacterium]